MTLCDFEQQTTLSICQGNIDKHPIVCGEQDTKQQLQDHGRLPVIVDGQDLCPSRSLRGKRPREAMTSPIAHDLQ